MWFPVQLPARHQKSSKKWCESTVEERFEGILKG